MKALQAQHPDAAPLVIEPDGLRALVAVLGERGYRVVGPTVRDGAIVLDELRSAAELPWGSTATQDAARYRLEPRADAGPIRSLRVDFLPPFRPTPEAVEGADGVLSWDGDVTVELPRSCGTGRDGARSLSVVRACSVPNVISVSQTGTSAEVSGLVRTKLK